MSPVFVGYTLRAPNTAESPSSQVPIQSAVQKEHMPDWGERTDERFLVSLKDEDKGVAYDMTKTS